MRRLRQSNNGGHTTTLPFSAAIIFTLLLRFIIPLDVHCNNHYSNMAVTKQSDVAAAAAIYSKPTVKVSKPKEQCQQTRQRSLCPQGNSCSPMESNTNSHIASIN
jgi:hypothetical protein